jgi:hypothetical protein
MTRWIDAAEQSVWLLNQKRDVAMRVFRGDQRYHDPHCKTQIAALHIAHSHRNRRVLQGKIDIMEAASVPTITSSSCFPAQAG